MSVPSPIPVEGGASGAQDAVAEATGGFPARPHSGSLARRGDRGRGGAPPAAPAAPPAAAGDLGGVGPGESPTPATDPGAGAFGSPWRPLRAGETVVRRGGAGMFVGPQNRGLRCRTIALVDVSPLFENVCIFSWRKECSSWGSVFLYLNFLPG